jgi:pimeloyl-ACP methyl ester carboxylesterase
MRMCNPNTQLFASNLLRTWVGLVIAFFAISPSGSRADTLPQQRSRVEGTSAMRFAPIKVGGRRLYYLCRGRGSPTVIAEGGPGFSFSQVFARAKPNGWQIVFLKVIERTRMCVYDRANVGLSDKARIPRTVLDAVKDLHALIHQAKIESPLLLVGQSAGGLNVRLYANRYPHEVAGMVLIDSSHPDQNIQFKAALPPESPGEWWELAGLRNGPPVSFSSEGLDLPASDAQVRAAVSLGDLPLIVLTHDPRWPGDPGTPVELQPILEGVWQPLQRDLLTLSKNSRQIVAAGAGHAIQFYNPQLVVDSIFEVMSKTP